MIPGFLILFYGSNIFGQLEGGETESISVVFIPKTQDPDNGFWVTMIDGAKSAAKEYGVELTILAPELEDDYQLQREYILEGIKRKPDAMVIAPIHVTELNGAIEQAIEAGIEVVLVDSNIDQPLDVSYIGTNNEAAGEILGKYLKEQLSPDSKIMLMSYVKESSTAIEREAGIRKGLGEYEACIEGVLYCNSSYDVAYTETKKWMEENPETNVIVGLNLYATVGVARAIDQQQEQVSVMGFDNDTEGIGYLEKGLIQVLIVQKPFHVGYFGLENAVKITRGEEVWQTMYSEIEVITKDNIYTEENEKLLFPF